MCTSARASPSSQRLARRAAFAIPAAVLVGVLGGCAAGPDFVRPALPTFSRQDVVDVSEAPVSATWWNDLGDERIGTAVEDALAHSATLESARHTLERTQHELRAGQSLFLPDLGLTGLASRQRARLPGGSAGAATALYTAYTLQGAIGYVIDVFGGVRREVEARSATVDEARHELEAARLSLTANVVQTAISRAAYAAEIEASRKLIAALETQARLAQAQVVGGTGNGADALAFEAQLANARGALATLEARARAADHLQSALAGRWPDEAIAAPALEHLRAPQGLPRDLPRALVRRRPDILAAEARLHIASAQVGIATAALLPTLSLSGTFGKTAPDVGHLDAESSTVWSAGALGTLPLLQSGGGWPLRRAAQAAYAAAAADYRETVLSAFAQVADLLAALESDEAALRAATEARDAATRRSQLTVASATGGVADGLAVSAAELTWRTAEIAWINADAALLSDTVALHAALGGGMPVQPR